MWMKVVKYIVGTLIVFSFLHLYFRYFEWKNIYYSTREISRIPESIGLKFEDIFFETNDHVKLNGWYVPCEGAISTLLFCHGNAGNISDRLDSIDIFHNLGLNIFIFDYRGYGKSRGFPTEKGTYLDAMAAYSWLISEKKLDEDKLIIFGRSLGGSIAIDLASKINKGLLISESAFTSIIDIGKEFYPFLPIKYCASIKYDSIQKIKSIKIPKLIIHSEEDEIIPFHHGEKIFKAALSPKQFYQMRGGHNDGFIIMGKEYEETIKNFIKKNLK
ncbi:alpha/beta hydrolase [bacterium]|nr:alpha/beta hydrolase [bacterium]